LVGAEVSATASFRPAVGRSRRHATPGGGTRATALRERVACVVIVVLDAS
jgi:hypothetical protein